MKIKYLALLFFSIFTCNLYSFTSEYSDTVFNQTDANGLKQGYWKVTYENGKVKYEGFFVNNKPVGELKRYYDDGTKKAILIFDKSGKKASAKMYYNNGELAGEGNFIESMKDSVWKYYSYYDKSLKMIETYNKGIRNGITQKIFTNGVVAEVLNYTNNLKNGAWKQYYDNGTLKLETNFVNDKRKGAFATYYLSGKIESKGTFDNNKMQGDWVYYNEDGSVKMTINYINDIPQNPEALDKQNEEFFKMLDSNKGKIPEPDENNMMPMQ
jgi:antitoxin component YwqK of YwqJK toxin-antitoxin module